MHTVHTVESSFALINDTSSCLKPQCPQGSGLRLAYGCKVYWRFNFKLLEHIFYKEYKLQMNHFDVFGLQMLLHEERKW